MRFKIDVSDRETGEVGSVEVEAPTAQAARQHLREAGYMIWATEPVASTEPTRQLQSYSKYETRDRLIEQAQEGTFRAHPIRFLLGPIVRLLGGILVYLSIVMAFGIIHNGIALPFGWAATARNVCWAGILVWLLGRWIGWPIAKGRRAQRAIADAEMVCRYCRRRGHVTTQERGVLRKRLWGHCTNCGIRWML
jgi:hypothetical protein